MAPLKNMRSHIDEIPPMVYVMGDVVTLVDGAWRSFMTWRIVRDDFVNEWGVFLEPQVKPTPADVKDAHE